MTKIENSTILYIEDDFITQEQFTHFLKQRCRTLYTASNGKEGLELFKKFEPDIIITDIQMPQLNGLEMAQEVRKLSLSTQIIIMSAYTKPEYLLEAINLQLVQYLIKPTSLAKVTESLKIASNFLDCKSVNTKEIFTDYIYYDTYTKELIKEERVVNLSKYERGLLELLISKYPAPISYETIDSDIYNFNSSKNAIKLLVSSLREKVTKEVVTNVSGFGYKLNPKT